MTISKHVLKYSESGKFKLETNICNLRSSLKDKLLVVVGEIKIKHFLLNKHIRYLYVRKRLIFVKKPRRFFVPNRPNLVKKLY